MRIVGDVREGNKVAISAIVRGGVEGASRVQWFKTTFADLEPDESGMEAISTSRIAKVGNYDSYCLNLVLLSIFKTVVLSLCLIVNWFHVKMALDKQASIKISDVRMKIRRLIHMVACHNLK